MVFVYYKGTKHKKMKTILALGIATLMFGSCAMEDKQPDDSAGYEHHDSPIDSLDQNHPQE